MVVGFVSGRWVIGVRSVVRQGRWVHWGETGCRRVLSGSAGCIAVRICGSSCSFGFSPGSLGFVLGR